MRLSLSKILTVVLLTAVTVTIAKLSDVAFAHLSWRLGTVQCAYDYFGVECLLAEPAESTLLLVVLMLLAAFFYLRFRGAGSSSNYAPFVMFLSGLLIVCTSFDLAFGLHAFNMSKVYTSTVNTFSYILIFTFVVMLMIKRYSPYSFMVSVIGSFTVKVSAFFALGLLLPVIPGATGMFALFVTYSFAAFGLHLMMACRLFVAKN
jgi:hypothetical protein